MEMQTYESLNRIHGMDAGPRHRGGAGLKDQLRRLAAGFNAFVLEPVLGEIRAREAIRQLREMDDRMLDDIGIKRSQIETAVRRGARR